jgi:hypothetical protein
VVLTKATGTISASETTTGVEVDVAVGVGSGVSVDVAEGRGVGCGVEVAVAVGTDVGVGVAVGILAVGAAVLAGWVSVGVAPGVRVAFWEQAFRKAETMVRPLRAVTARKSCLRLIDDRARDWLMLGAPDSVQQPQAV